MYGGLGGRNSRLRFMHDNQCGVPCCCQVDNTVALIAEPTPHSYPYDLPMSKHARAHKRGDAPREFWGIFLDGVAYLIGAILGGFVR